MAFPTTGILYAGTGGDESPATGFTDGPDGGTYGGIKRASNLIRSVSGDSWDYWTTPDFGPDSEAYLTGVTFGSAAGTMNLELRFTPIGSGVDGYSMEMRYDGLIRIYRVDNVTYTKLGADITTGFTNGDGFGVSMVGDTITAYTESGGTWTSQGTRTDSTYTAAGKITTYIGQSDMTATGFGGGTVVVASGNNTRRSLLGVGR